MPRSTPIAIERTHSYQDQTRDQVQKDMERDRQAALKKLGDHAVDLDTSKIRSVVVYVCPTEGCDDYYGASGMGDLTQAVTGPKTEDRHTVSLDESRVGEAGKRHSLAECPSCRTRGIFVDRVPRTAFLLG